MKSILSFIIVATTFFTSLAQEISFSAEVDTTQILIGQQVRLQLRAELPENTDFSWPGLPDTLTGLEVVEAGTIDTTEENGMWTVQQSYRLTSFDSGYAVVPPLSLTAGEESFASVAVGISVYLPEMTEQDDLYDIKQPLEAPANWWPLIFTILAILVVVAVIVYIIYYLRKRGKRKKLTPEQMLSPYEYAQMQLREIEREKLWQNAKVKEYYSRLTDVMRLYMERQMHINAMESTADEVADKTDNLNVSRELKRKIREMMGLSALVKYAKGTPSTADHEQSMETVKEFLKETKPRDEEKEVAGVGSRTSEAESK